MRYLQGKRTLLIAPVDSTNGETNTANLDCKGQNFVEIDVQIGAFAGGTNGVSPLVCKLSESDDTVVTNFTDISGASAASSITASGNVRFFVNLAARKRYLRLTFSPATASTNSSTIVSAVAKFTESDDMANSTSDFGDTVVKIV